MSTLAALDPELRGVVARVPGLTATVDADQIPAMRAVQERLAPNDEALARGGSILVETAAVERAGAPPVPLLTLRPSRVRDPRATVLFFHGGGMICGTERTGLDALLEWVEQLGIAVVSVGYRLAPEHPYPAAADDGMAALRWLAPRAEGPLVIAGMSAGAGIAAGLALRARDEGNSPLAAQVLMGPMLDDRACQPSSTAYRGDAVWDAPSNAMAWSALLGTDAGGEGVPCYAAPARCIDLASLPPAFVDVGEVETFRDEAVDYATRLGKAGVDTELHVWPGAFHGFDVIAPEAAVSCAARAARLDFLARLLGR